MRKLGRFSVTIPAHATESLLARGMLEEVSGVLVQAAEGLYRPGLGVDIESKIEAESLII